MNKKILMFLLIFVIVVSASVFFLLTNNNTDTQTNNLDNNIAQDQQNTQQATPSDSEDSSESTARGVYTDYNPSVIETTSGTKLLFFHASWCPQCRKLESDIKSKGVPDGVTIIKVDYDSNQSLRQKYGVTLQTTVVKVDDQGNLVEKFVAYEDPSLEAIKQNLL